MIRFDKEAPGEGVDYYVTLQNAKAEIHFRIYLRDDSEESRTGKKTMVELYLRDEKGMEAARMSLKAELCGEATARTLLIYPHLWDASEHYGLYHLRADIVSEGKITDTLEICCAVTEVRMIPENGLYVNGKPFALRGVQYDPKENWQTYLAQDLKIMRQLGANCICLEELPVESAFYRQCLESGIFIWKNAGKNRNIPFFIRGEEGLVSDDRKYRRDRFYYYQACWSRQEVLHVCTPSSVGKTTVGESAVVTVYSNQKRVALYVNGILHEFKESAPVFRFEDVPLRGEQTVITAQAGEHYSSVTI